MQDSVIQESVPLARDGDTIAEVRSILEIQLDQPGLGRFKIEHPWIASIQILPFNAIFSDGEIVEQWAGSGTSRLEEKLLSIMS